jgi:integrase
VPYFFNPDCLRILFNVSRRQIVAGLTRHRDPAGLPGVLELAVTSTRRRQIPTVLSEHALGPAEVEAFLTHLAVASKVSASTQNQALQALLFLYRQVLGIELPWLTNVTRAARPRLRAVLSVAEVRSVLAQLDGTCWLIANLLHGSGLRLMEAHRLRVKDLALDRGEVLVRESRVHWTASAPAAQCAAAP